MLPIDFGAFTTGYRNKIINGDFDIWQRGTSFTPANGTYTADRFIVTYNGSGATRTISQQTHTLGQTNVPGNPVYFLRHAQSVAGSGATYNAISHRIEGVKIFANKTATVTFWAKAASTLVMPSIVLRESFGVGGSPSSFVDTTVASNVSIGTSWQKVTYTVTLPSISGKTLGTSGGDYTELILFLPINTTFTFDLSHISVVEGDATSETDPFSPRHIGQELVLCQRYCYVIGASTFITVGNNRTGGTTGYFGFKGPTIMRSSPSITSTGTIQVYSGDTSGAVSALGSGGIDSILTSASYAATGSVGQTVALYTNNGTITFDAEL